MKEAESFNLHTCSCRFCCMVCYLTHNFHELIVSKVEVGCSTWMAVNGHGLQLIIRLFWKSMKMYF